MGNLCTSMMRLAAASIDALLGGTGYGGRFMTGMRSSTNLIEAVIQRSADSVNELLRGGADINARNDNGMSALNVASEKGFTDIVRILLDNGADIENRNHYGRTPLFNAAMNGHIDVVKLLIGNAARVHTELNNGASAPVHSSFTEQFGVKSEPEHRGADVDAEDFDGLQPIRWPIRQKFIELVELLIQAGANVDASGRCGNTPLHEAALASNGLMIVQLLVRYGAKLNVQNNDGKTPLHYAVQLQRLEVIMFLLSQDADVGLTDVWRNSPLHYVASRLSELLRKRGFGEYFTKLLVKKQFLRNILGMSAMTYIAAHGTSLINAVGLYIRNEDLLSKASTYADCQGNTPLHYAAGVYTGASLEILQVDGYDVMEVVELMLVCDADINAQNNEGQTPLHVARGEAIMACLHYADEHSFAITDKRGRNFWHLLFLIGNEYRVEILSVKGLQHMIGVSSAQDNVDDLKRTPLHYACMSKKLWCIPKCHEFMKEFVNAVSDENINKQDKFGRTPLHYAVISRSWGFPGLVDFLVTSKADDTIQDMFGKTYSDYKSINEAYDAKDCSKRLIVPLRMEETKFHAIAASIASISNDNVECITDRLRAVVKPGESTECDNAASYVRTIYLGCQSDYANDHFIDLVAPKEYLYDKNLATANQSTTMFAAIQNCVEKAMEYLAANVSAHDSRFACEAVAVGSAYEGTKIGHCDEFDYNFVLNNLSRMCKVDYSPESPPGFVLLKASTPDHDEDLFNSNGTLETRIVKFKFESLVKQVLSSLRFCETTGFEFIDVVGNDFLLDENILVKINLQIKLAFTQQVLGRHVPHKISVDIVPALQMVDWWPDDAHRQDLCQKAECQIVFTQPQKKYPWVGWTEPQGFISFARAESRLLLESPQVVKAAYMVVKHMSMHFSRRKFICNLFSSYVIKTALLWCLDEEGFNACSSSGDNDEVNEDELLRLVQNILRRLLCFAAQDYLPCYFMPKCHQPVWLDEDYLKKFHMHLYQRGLTYEDLLILHEEQFKDAGFLKKIRNAIMFSHVMYWAMLSETDELKLFVPSTINPLREISYVDMQF